MSSDRWAGVHVVDAHAHLAPPLLTRYRAALQECGIGSAFVVPAAVISPMDLSRGIVLDGPGHDVDADNAGLVALLADEPLIRPFWFANPNHCAGPDDVVGISHGAGLKFAPAVHGIGHLDPRVQTYVDIAGSLGRPVYAHCVGTGARSVAAYAELARRNPDVYFFLGHGGRGNFDLLAVEEIADCDNMLFETSGAFDFAVEEALRRLGADRVVFGSEFPIQHPRVELTKLTGTVPERHWAAVLGGTVAEVTGTSRKDRTACTSA